MKRKKSKFVYLSTFGLIFLISFVDSQTDIWNKIEDFDLLTYENNDSDLTKLIIDQEEEEGNNSSERIFKRALEDQQTEGSGSYDTTVFFTTQPSSSTTEQTDPNTYCSSTLQCKKQYIGSVCIKGLCKCLPPTTFVNNVCKKSLPIKLNLPVFVPINDVCEILFDESPKYSDTFEKIITNIGTTNPKLKPVYLTTNVDNLKFQGDYSYVKKAEVCPPRSSRSMINMKRFIRAVEENQVVAYEQEILTKYTSLIRYCNDSAKKDYNVSLCWQKFYVEYTVYFDDTTPSDESVEVAKQKYEKLFLEALVPSKDENLFLLKLNDTSEERKIFLSVEPMVKVCESYFNQSENQQEACLNGANNSLIFEMYQNDLIEEIINEKDTSTFSDMCNIVSDTCVFENRVCRSDEENSLTVCDCQYGYYSPNAQYIDSDCQKCSRKCQNNGQCVRKDREYCYCRDLYFGEFCQINGLVIIIIGSLLLFFSVLICSILWICFFKRKREQNIVSQQPSAVQEDQEIHYEEHLEEFKKEKIIQTSAPANLPDPLDDLNKEFEVESFQTEWDQYAPEEDLNWDIIFGKNDQLTSVQHAEAINPAFFTKTNLMIPRANSDGPRSLFGSSVSSKTGAKLVLPAPVDFSDFKGIPKAWYPLPGTSDIPIDYDTDSKQEEESKNTKF